MRILIFGLILSLNLSQAEAQVIYGPGKKPCSALVKAWEGGSFFDKNFFDAWVTGFVGGANWISKNQSMRMKLFLDGITQVLQIKSIGKRVYRGYGSL